MPVNINGYALSNSSGLSFGASGTKIIAADYGIRDPMLPGMLGSATGGGTYGVHPYPVNDVNLNVGSPWSTSTYLFTAPVAGIYYTSYSGIVGDGTGGPDGYYSVMVNGSTRCYSYRYTNNTWELHHVEVMLKLAAGDTVSWAMNHAPGPTSGSPQGGAYQSNHNTCTIWLVG